MMSNNENIMEKNSHSADTIRYLVMACPKYHRTKAYAGMDDKIY